MDLKSAIMVARPKKMPVVWAANEFWVASLVLVMLFAHCQAGKVHIVQSLTTLQQNQGSGSLQIELSEVASANAVNISCNQLQFGVRKAKLVFDPAVIPVNSGSGNVTIRIISPGEAVSVSCYGISQNNGGQYLQTNSTGRIGSIIVSKAPTISICSEYIYVKDYSNAVQTFDVTLSGLTSRPVIVECFVTSQSSSSNLQLQFDRVSVPASQSTIKVPFRVTRAGSAVKVACRAQDVSCLPTESTTIAFTSVQSSTNTIIGRLTRSMITPSITRHMSQSTVNNSSATISTLNQTFSTSVSINTLSESDTVTLNPTLLSYNTFDTSLATSSSSLTSTTSSAAVSTASSVSSISPNRSSSSTLNSSLNTTASRNNNTLYSSSSHLTPATSKSSQASSVAVASTSAINPTTPPTNSPPTNFGFCQYLFNTSVGPSVTFTSQKPSIKAYPQSSEMQSLYKHISYIVLDSRLEGSSNMDLQCGIKSIIINQVEETVCNSATGLPTISNSIVVLNQVTLELLEKKITFKPGELSKSITIQVKRLESNESFFQLFHVFCCAPVSNTKYKGTTVSVYLWIDSMSNVAFSWANVPTISQRAITPITNLDYSCPCNLKTSQCDINCCCDKDCSTYELQQFSCLTDAFGGRQVKSFEFGCQATWPDRKDWTPVLCVVTNNSPFLGYFLKYTSPALATSSADYNKLISGRTFYDYEEKEARNSQQSNTIGYVYGAPIRTTIGLLALPSQFHENSCLFTSVRYLRNTRTNCIHKATRQRCTHASFNALNYVMPTGLTYPACSAPGILSGQSASFVVAKSIEYYCVNGSSSFVIASSKEQSISADKESLFAGGSTTNQFTRCAFDDTKTRPPVPVFDSSSNTCQNAVIAVDYQIQWNGPQLRSVKAKITLGSFPASTVTLSPVTYTYYPTRVIAVMPSMTVSSAPLASSPVSTATLSSAVERSAYVNITSSSVKLNPLSSSLNLTSTPSAKNTLNASVTATQAVSRRSSIVPKPTSTLRSSLAINISYVTLTVRTTTVVYKNVTVVPSVLQRFTASFSYTTSANTNISLGSTNVVHRSGNPGYVLGKPLISLTQNSTKTKLGLLMWKPAKTGLCSDATTTSIQFGKDASSGCLLRFGVDKFANCSALIELVKQSQDKLIQAIKVAKHGNPSASVSTDWLDVISVPTPHTVINLTRNGICHNIPSRLLIEILIAEAGMSYGKSQMEISGIRLSYKTETWSMPCSSGANSRCYNTSVANNQFTTPLLSTFAVTSTVSFVTIPAVEPPGVKRSADVSGICRYDVCIQELFYPIRNIYNKGVIEFNLALTQNATAMAVTLIFVAFGALFVSRPWRN